jgi:hypothetical protein
MKKNICLLLIAALMCSCAGQDNGKDDFITISIDPEDSQIVSIADFFEKIAIVPLETNDTILINAVYNIIPLNKRLYILDRRSSSVFIFPEIFEYFIFPTLHRQSYQFFRNGMA